MGIVLDVIEERGEPPFLDVKEVIAHMEGSGITGFDISIAISRLICNEKLRLALDGIRVV